jgi:hypothetical protein
MTTKVYITFKTVFRIVVALWFPHRNRFVKHVFQSV